MTAGDTSPPSLFGRGLAMLRRRGFRELGWSLGGSGTSLLLGIATSILLARVLGPEGFGILSIALALAFAVSGLADWGLSVTLIRLASPLLAVGQPVRHVHSVFLLLRLSLLGLLGAAVAFSSHWLLPSLKLPPAYPWLAAAGAMAGMALGIGSHFNAMLQAIRDQRGLAVVRAATGTLRLAAYAVIAASLPGTVAPFVAAALLAMPIESALIAARAGRLTPLWPLDLRPPPRAWLAFSFWAALPAVSFSLVGQTDTLLMAAVAGPAETGHWAAAARASGVLLLASGAIWSVALPYGTALSSREQLAGYMRLVRVGVLPLAGIVVAALALAPLVVRLAFGARYLDAIPAMQLLLVANGCGAVGLVLTPVAFRFRRERLVAAVGALQFATNLGGDLLLIPRWGATGCAAATLAMQTLATAVLCVRVLTDVAGGRPLPPARLETA